MLENILEFLTNNKIIIIGATVTLTEVLTVIINFRRKNKAEQSMISTMGTNYKYKTISQKLLWSLNPINLFRKS